MILINPVILNEHIESSHQFSHLRKGLSCPLLRGQNLWSEEPVFYLQTPWSKAGKLKYSPWSVGFVSSVFFSVDFRISIIAFSAEKLQRFVTWACGLLVYHRDGKFLSWTLLLFPRKVNWNLQMVPGSQFHISWLRTCITNKENLLVYLLDTAICQTFQLYRCRVWWDEYVIQWTRQCYFAIS